MSLYEFASDRLLWLAIGLAIGIGFMWARERNEQGKKGGQ